tara:strand:- start:3688 stop:4248 length:561 start_codon:yes stop_codon:yes gene_type:complete
MPFTFTHANALRCIIIGKIPCWAWHHIEIPINTSRMTSYEIKHRLEMIPAPPDGRLVIDGKDTIFIDGIELVRLFPGEQVVIKASAVLGTEIDMEHAKWQQNRCWYAYNDSNHTDLEIETDIKGRTSEDILNEADIILQRECDILSATLLLCLGQVDKSENDIIYKLAKQNNIPDFIIPYWIEINN